MPFTERFTESFKEIAQNFFNNTFINIFPKMRFKRARELHALDQLAEASRAATKKRLLETAAAVGNGSGASGLFVGDLLLAVTAAAAPRRCGQPAGRQRLRGRRRWRHICRCGRRPDSRRCGGWVLDSSPMHAVGARRGGGCASAVGDGPGGAGGL